MHFMSDCAEPLVLEGGFLDEPHDAHRLFLLVYVKPLSFLQCCPADVNGLKTINCVVMVDPFTLVHVIQLMFAKTNANEKSFPRKTHICTIVELKGFGL